MQEDGMPPTGIEYHELKMNTLGLFRFFVRKYARHKDKLLCSEIKVCRIYDLFVQALLLALYNELLNFYDS